MSVERRKMLRLLGAELELTPAARGMSGAIQRAEQLLKEIPNSIMPQQFSNPANPEIHRKTTAEEIFNDCDGKLDYFLAGVGTGGTITGVGEVLKPRIPGLKIIAIEPEDSPVISGGQPGPHKIQGLGAGFIPDNLHREVIDEVLTVSNANAFAMARKVAKIEGLPAGISSGAALAAACELGRRPGMEGKRIMAILPSSAERYLSTALFEGLE
jgi:cysteine synthase A